MDSSYLYQKTGAYFAQVADDIKDIAEREIISLGAHDTRIAYRGISFKADLKTIYKLNYCTRLVSRLLAPLIRFDCHSEHYLYKTALQIRWEDFINPSMTFAVFSSVANSSIKHSQYAALRLKDAVVDRFKEYFNERPSIDTLNPDLWLNLHIENNEATISLDTSGGSLHRRGYRKDTVATPMIETLAAAIVEYSGWDRILPVYDPFCGSGTLLCEAYLYASNTPPGILRKKFGFERMPDFDRATWDRVKEETESKITPVKKGLISGSDISPEAVRYALNNRSVIDRKKVIEINKKDIFDIEEIKDKIIICNPPYGIRTPKNVDLEVFYRRLGDFLKQRCNGSTAYIYFGERRYIKSVGLKPSWKTPLSNGGLDGRLVKYEMY
ncbi:MAG: class I SAM-dependent RNA methyltransferase [Deltaproteobacteria bacterium]|nr:class I SAM-dependent RNA methyltransferase [Deltaproteobacteria bacterium]